MKAPAVVALIILSSRVLMGEVSRIAVETTPQIIRAELWYVEPSNTPEAILVLCPGVNGSGEGLVRSEIWQKFTAQNNLGLVGLSFASPLPAIYSRTGYYQASQGSGDKLIEGLRKIYGEDLPLLLYGFSGGAHFVSRFEAWRPERVLAWCAYSAVSWDLPQKSPANPPGIVACGEDDERLGPSLIYFKQGRALGKPWLWVCLPDTGHESSSKLDHFVRAYFSSILRGHTTGASFVDIDLKTSISPDYAQTTPSLTAWLPSSQLLDGWKKIHHP